MDGVVGVILLYLLDLCLGQAAAAVAGVVYLPRYEGRVLGVVVQYGVELVAVHEGSSLYPVVGIGAGLQDHVRLPGFGYLWACAHVQEIADFFAGGLDGRMLGVHPLLVLLVPNGNAGGQPTGGGVPEHLKLQDHRLALGAVRAGDVIQVAHLLLARGYGAGHRSLRRGGEPLHAVLHVLAPQLSAKPRGAHVLGVPLGLELNVVPQHKGVGRAVRRYFPRFAQVAEDPVALLQPGVKHQKAVVRLKRQVDEGAPSQVDLRPRRSGRAAQPDYSSVLGFTPLTLITRMVHEVASPVLPEGVRYNAIRHGGSRGLHHRGSRRLHRGCSGRRWRGHCGGRRAGWRSRVPSAGDRHHRYGGNGNRKKHPSNGRIT